MEKKLGKTGLDNFTQGKITSTGMCTQSLCKILPKCECMFRLNKLLKLWKFYPSAAGDAGDIVNVLVELYMLEAKPAKRA